MYGNSNNYNYPTSGVGQGGQQQMYGVAPPPNVIFTPPPVLGGQVHSIYQQQTRNDMAVAVGPISASQQRPTVGSNQGILFDSSFPLLSSIVNNANRQAFGQSNVPNDFSMQKEDFPALSSRALMDGNPISGNNGNTQQAGTSSQSKDAKYGLTGLLDIIRMADRDLSALALGSDLTTFGLNLNSTDNLYSSFTSPFSDQPASSEPQYTTPSCYMMPPPTLKFEHLSKFTIETVFYIFYSMPRDLMQTLASQELYRRDWKYHGELKVWLKPRSQQDLIQGHPNVQFLYFDINDWQARLFTTTFRGNLLQGLLTEDDIRGLMKGNTQQQTPQQMGGQIKLP